MRIARRLIHAPLFIALAAILLCQGSGCDKPSGLKLVPVTGKVLLGDQPLTRGSLSFRHQDAEPGKASPEPSGIIGEDGTYTLFTDQKPGAPVGKYYVLVVSTEDIDPQKASAAPKSLIDRKYADILSRHITIEVVEQASAGQYDIVLKK